MPLTGMATSCNVQDDTVVFPVLQEGGVGMSLEDRSFFRSE